MDNLRYYNQGREVPQEARKNITAGRLKGMTDVNPMWRIKKLTEMFGACGTGWYYTTPEYQFIPGDGGAVACIAQTSIIYRDENGWSQPVTGVGGAMYVAVESKCLYTDDEAPKKALTDALSVACKALGIGADVYFEKDRTKYDARTTEEKVQEKKANVEANPVVNMATQHQIDFVKRYADDTTYQNAMTAFGADLEKMNFKQAEKLIARINKQINGGV